MPLKNCESNTAASTVTAESKRASTVDLISARQLWFVGIFNAVLLAWDILRPGTTALVSIVSNIADSLGPIIAGVWCLSAVFQLRGQPGRSKNRTVPICFAVAAMSYGFGTLLWTYFEWVTHTAPFPSLCDAFYILAYPGMIAGILLMPSRRVVAAARMRVLLDSFIILASVVTFSWYFVLGPTILSGGSSLLAKILSPAYPVCDLIILACSFMLSRRTVSGTARQISMALSIGFLMIVLSDTWFGYQSLKGTYVSSHWPDIGWSIGYMLIGAAGARFARQKPESIEDELLHSDERNPVLWRSLLPYLCVPIVGGLLWYTCRVADNPLLETGVKIGAAVIFVLILARQIFALVENSHLYQFLNEAYGELKIARADLEAHNEALTQANIRLESLALTDGLTAISNHRAFQDQLHEEFESARASAGSLSVILMDVDCFKQFNDTFGHPAGDEVLKRVARLLTDESRSGDCVARYGGEEFAIVLRGVDINRALFAAERLRTRLAAEPWEHRAVTASFGVSTCMGGFGDASEMVRQADRALYASKASGRNCVTHFTRIDEMKTA